MEELLSMAKASFDGAEVYSRSTKVDQVEYQNGKLHEIESARQSGVALRILDGGRLGFAFTRNLRDRGELLGNARASAGGVEAGFDLPSTRGLPELATRDPAIEAATTELMAEECARVAGIVEEGTEGEVSAVAWTVDGDVRIRNSSGTDLSARTSYYVLRAQIVFPGSHTGFVRRFRARAFGPTPDSVPEEIVALYNAAGRTVRPESGRMKVLFMPQSLITFTWRIMSGTSGESLYQGITPLGSRVGEQVLGEKLTIDDDPRDITHEEARPFDDEGVECDRFPLFEKGVLRGFYSDLRYAAKLGIDPTGHGHRMTAWGGDPLTTRPRPVLAHLSIRPGESTFEELVRMIDRGIILETVLGPHSGNIPNGDYSVGVNPALYVEDGEIAGRVKDGMVAGNVYETFSEVVAVGDRQDGVFGGWAPPVLCDNVSVACK